MFVPNHLHLIVRAHVDKPPSSEKELNDWLEELVGLVDMKVVAGPTSVYVHDEGNEGVTGTITLATSHASIHVWDHERPSLVQFDIYSCKEYSIESVFAHLNKFETVSYQWLFIDRNDGIHISSGGWWDRAD
jgi:S-adenosylmethionine/arginine decarboxylase-like enzyme